MNKLLLILCLVLSVTACSDDLRFVSIQYEGYNMPKGVSIWLENGPAKMKAISGEGHFWSGYFIQGDVFSITVVKDGKRLRVLNTIFVNNLDNRIIRCNLELTSCQE